MYMEIYCEWVVSCNLFGFFITAASGASVRSNETISTPASAACNRSNETCKNIPLIKPVLIRLKVNLVNRYIQQALCFSVVLALFMLIAISPGSSTPNKASFGKHSTPRYNKNEIIVCLNADADITQSPGKRPTTKIARIDRMSEKFRVSRMDPVFTDLKKPGAAVGLAKRLANTYKIRFDADVDPLLAAKSYAALPEVEYAEPVYTYNALRTDPNDTFWNTSNSWGQGYRDQWDMENMHCPEAWDLQTGSSSIVVAVSDTGVDYNHPDLQVNAWCNPGEIPSNGIDDDGNGKIDDYHGYDFVNNDGDPMDDNGHGTHCAGSIGAAGNNGIGIAGVSWNCKLMGIKGLSRSGSGSSDALAIGIKYAVDEGADIINMSWGGEGWSQVVQDALLYAHDRNVVLCAAAGNDNHDVVGFYPATSNFVISVAASDQNNAKCYFSNWGIKIAVTAPGGNGGSSSPVCSTYNTLSTRANTTDAVSGSCGAGTCVVGTNYYRLGGTSMACPHVSGLAALILAQNPSWSNEQVRQAIQMRADDVQAVGFDRFSGFGRINAYSSLTCSEPMTAFIRNPRNGAGLWGTVAVNGTAAGPNITGWVLDYGWGNTPTSWTVVASGISAIIDNKLADWNVNSLASGVYTLRLRTSGTGSVQNAEYRIQIETSGPPPANDDCSTPTIINLLPYQDVQDTSSATDSPNDPTLHCIDSSAFNTVWYSYTAAAQSTINIDTLGSNYDTVLGVWQGNCGSLINIACNDDVGAGVTSEVSFQAAAGVTYLIEVASYSSGGGSTSSLYVAEANGVPLDYFTEMFQSNSFDLANTVITFTPDESGNFYSACINSITDPLPEPVDAMSITLGDDEYAQITLAEGAQVSLYGVTYDRFFVGSNGFITFGSGDSDYSESLEDHFALPRISAMFNDLDPTSGGSVYWEQFSDRTAVTYLNIPEFSGSTANTFRTEIFFDGRIRISYYSIGVTDGLAGISRGSGLPTHFTQSNLSAYAQCPENTHVLSLVMPNGGEWYEPGDSVQIEWSVIGGSWTPDDTIKLEYSSNGGSMWNQIPGAEALSYSAGEFTWDTTGYPASNAYRIKATCNQNSTASDTSDGNFRIETDITPPVITHTPLQDTGNRAGPYRVCAVVTDDFGVDDVRLYWSKNTGAFSSVKMTATQNPNEYCAEIPGPSITGNQYCYYIEARDGSNGENVSRSPAGAPGNTYCFVISDIVEVLSYIEFADTGANGEYQETLRAIETVSNRFHNTELTNSADLASAIAGKHVLLIPEQENASSNTMASVGSSWTSILNGFLSTGGRVVVCDHHAGGGSSYALLAGAGLMSITGAADITGQQSHVVDVNSPFTAGVASPYIAESGSIIFTTADGTALVQTNSGGKVVIRKSIGIGDLILIGHDYFMSNASQDRLVGNAVFVNLTSQSIGQNKRRPDGSVVSLERKKVSAVFDGRLYVQDDDRFTGIGVLWGGAMPDVGNLVNVSGTLTTLESERIIQADKVEFEEDSTDPKPLAMNYRSVGGNDFFYSTGLFAAGQRGITGGIGLNNIGLLVKIWGSVVDIDPAENPAWFKVAEIPQRPVLVTLPAGVDAPDMQAFIAVTGISSLYDDGTGNILPKIKVRRQDDILPAL